MMSIDKPTLEIMRDWPLEIVREQRELELAEHRANLDNLTYGAGLDNHYRLGYMQWLLDGKPEPMPRFV